jgi:hypothetical protein
MTLKDFDPQALVSRKTLYQHQFLVKGLGDMSLDRRTDTINIDYMLSPKKKKLGSIKMQYDFQYLEIGAKLILPQHIQEN